MKANHLQENQSNPVLFTTCLTKDRLSVYTRALKKLLRMLAIWMKASSMEEAKKRPMKLARKKKTKQTIPAFDSSNISNFSLNWKKML